MENFTALTDDDLRDMLADLEFDLRCDYDAKFIEVIGELAWEIEEELRRRALEAMER